MAEQEKKLRLNTKLFLHDYVRGASEVELREKHSLKHSQLRRVVGALKKRGDIGSPEAAKRRANLKVRFGSEKGPPDHELSGKPPVDLDTGLVLHCPSCGAAVKRGGRHCGYCGSALDFSLKGKTIHCPHCFMRNPAEGQFCIRCAKPVKAAVPDGALLEERLCPRCDSAMIGRKVGDFSVVQCDECVGIFAPHETFETMQANSQRVIVSGRRGVQPEAAGALGGITYVRCPVCRKMMNRKNFADISGIIVDICGDHGIWFDAGELEKIMEFIARGGLQRSRAKDSERIKHEADIQRLRRDTARSGGLESTPFAMSSRDEWYDPGLVGVIGSVFKHLLT